jgi:hypothetical protein
MTIMQLFIQCSIPAHVVSLFGIHLCNLSIIIICYGTVTIEHSVLSYFFKCSLWMWTFSEQKRTDITLCGLLRTIPGMMCM